MGKSQVQHQDICQLQILEPICNISFLLSHLEDKITVQAITSWTFQRFYITILFYFFTFYFERPTYKTICWGWLLLKHESQNFSSFKMWHFHILLFIILYILFYITLLLCVMFYKVFGSFTSMIFYKWTARSTKYISEVNLDHLHSVTHKRWWNAHSWAQIMAVIM